MSRHARSIPMRSRPPSRARPGFTLLELILVLVIVATMMTVVAPSLQRFYASRVVEDAAGHFLALCLRARSLAIDEARVYRLHADLQEREYWLTREDGGERERLATELGRTFHWEPRIEVAWEGGTRSGSEAELVFHPDGRSQPAEVVFRGRREEDAVAVVCDAVSEPFRLDEPTEGVRGGD